MWQSLLVYNACPQPQTEATVLVSPSLLQIDTFGKWCRCLHNVCYVKLKKCRYLDKCRLSAPACSSAELHVISPAICSHDLCTTVQAPQIECRNRCQVPPGSLGVLNFMMSSINAEFRWDLAPRRGEGGGLAARAQHRRLRESDLARHIDVKEVDLPGPGSPRSTQEMETCALPRACPQGTTP